MSKPREYTADDPLLIQIIEHKPGDWTIEPHPKHHPKMNGRLKDPDKPGKTLKDRILDEWTARHPTQSQPDFLDPAQPEHVPMIIREGEFVRIECDPSFPFEVWVEKNKKVDPDPGAPADPFGWNGSHRSVLAGGNITAAVLIPPVDVNGDPTEPGPRAQGFYKFRALVYPPGAAPILVDPDGYCDG
jgi:hypothetical protein